MPNLNRFFIDAMLLMLFFGLLVLPVVSVGLAGYEHDTRGMEQQVLSESDVKSYTIFDSVKDTPESTQSTSAIENTIENLFIGQ